MWQPPHLFLLRRPVSSFTLDLSIILKPSTLIMHETPYFIQIHGLTACRIPALCFAAPSYTPLFPGELQACLERHVLWLARHQPLCLGHLPAFLLAARAPGSVCPPASVAGTSVELLGSYQLGAEYEHICQFWPQRHEVSLIDLHSEV